MKPHAKQDNQQSTNVQRYEKRSLSKKRHKTIDIGLSQIYLKKRKKVKQSNTNKILKFQGDKMEKQKHYLDDFNNFGLMKRIDQIQKRQNKYLKQIKSSLEIERQYKKTHQISKQAERRLKTQSLNQQNQKLIDLLVNRVQYKKMNSFFNKNIQKCVKLQESRMKVKQGSKSIVLPPMNFK